MPHPLPRRSALALLLALGSVLACDPGGSGEGTSPSLTPASRADVLVWLSDPSGAPVAGWVVLDPGRDAPAGMDGAARFPAVAPGPVAIRARAPGFEDAGPVALDVPEAGERSVSLTLTPAGAASLAIQVRTPGGRPVEGAVVTVDGVEVGATSPSGALEAVGLAPGAVVVRVEPPPGTLLPWETSLELGAGARGSLQPTLPARPPDGALHLGSGLCEECHGGEVAAWRLSAHARARRLPGAIDPADPLAAAFAAGEIVALPVPGARVILGRSGASWTAEVQDGAGASTGPLAVVEVYGGRSAGAALAIQGPEGRRVLPLGWTTPRSPGAAPGWTPAWMEGWFDGPTLVDPPGPEASFDLRCAGCHATGYSIDEGAGFSLVAADGPVVEGAVGCEACHGPAGAHPLPADGARASRIHQPGRASPGARLDACSRCHQRVTPDAHPLSAEPGPPLDDRAEPLPPWVAASEAGAPAPDRFPTAALSREHRDQGGDFASSAHAGDWLGGCSDCHDPHGSAHVASLRRAPDDDRLCTTCHRSGFPDPASVRAHSGHDAAGPGCVDCHLARAGRVLARSPLTGVGETRDHGLRVLRPEDALAAFDLAGVDVLPVDDVPVTPCLDCHRRAAAAAAEAGSSCACAEGDPTARATWVGQVADWAAWEAGR